MIKIRGNAIILLVLFINIACNNNRQGLVLEDYQAEQNIIITIDKQEKQKEAFLSQIEKVSLIPLEYDESFILSFNFPQTRVMDSVIYLFDDKQNKLFAFDSNGASLFVINSSGRGPKEYIEINNFSISNDNEIAMFDQAYQRMFYFDSSNGMFLRTESISTGADAVICIDNRRFASLTKNLTIREKDKNCIKITDVHGNIIHSFLPLPIWMQRSHLEQNSGAFSYYNNNIMLMLPWCYQVFSIGVDAIKCKYLLDYGALNIPKSYFEANQDDLDDMIHEIAEQKWAWAIDFFQESDRHVFFQTTISSDLYYTLFDKESGLASTMSRSILPIEWQAVAAPFLASNGNSFFCLTSIGNLDILSGMEDIKDSRLISLKNEYSIYRHANDYIPKDHLVMLSFSMH